MKFKDLAKITVLIIIINTVSYFIIVMMLDNKYSWNEWHYEYSIESRKIIESSSQMLLDRIILLESAQREEIEKKLPDSLRKDFSNVLWMYQSDNFMLFRLWNDSDLVNWDVTYVLVNKDTLEIIKDEDLEEWKDIYQLMVEDSKNF